MTTDGPRARRGSGTRLRRTVAVVVLSISLGNIVAFVWVAAGTQEFAQHLVTGPLMLAYPIVATIILWRRSHPVAYLLLVLAILLGPGQLLQTWLTERPTPPGDTAGWRLAVVLAQLTFPAFAMLLPALGLRFPDGRPINARWRAVEWLYAVGIAAVVVGMVTAPSVKGGPAGGPAWTVVNPIHGAALEPLRGGLELIATACLAPAVVFGLASIVVRYRRSVGTERLQMRWLVYAFFAVALTWPVAAGVAWVLVGRPGVEQVSNLFSVLLLAVPAMAIGIAVTRYHLYDIDRVVSRTVAYSIVTAVSAAVYAAGVLGLGAVLPGGSSDLLVAMSTLAVAALFQPLRRRVQERVDHRFNRAKVDADQALSTFAARMRDEVELDTVADHLGDVVWSRLQPSGVSLLLIAAPEPRS